jgi:ABC-type polysaccharide/polyol phosphate transport system ATPase subunit
MAPSIVATGLSKSFRVYASPKDMLLELVTRRPRHSEFPALTDVSFEIEPGEIVGVIGRNGAGKSTLLKLLARTLEPTSGSSTVRGRVSAILELGTGFHPDYSGRENALLGAICLGMSRREARARLDAIIAFAELGEFIDRPFRTYSSGMQARLTFATAVAATPDVLIVDEALAVGDARFQRKCFAHLERLRALGTTILLVSHDTNALVQLCSRAIWVERGRVRADGGAKEVSERYLRELLSAAPDAANGAADDAGAEGGLRYGSGAARIETVELLDEGGSAARTLAIRRPYRFRATVRAIEPLDDLHVGFALRTVRGVEVFGVNPRPQRVDPVRLAAGELAVAEVAFVNHLAPGDYFLTVGAWGLGADAHHDRRVDVLQVGVTGDAGALPQSLVDLEATYSIARDVPNGDAT